MILRPWMARLEAELREPVTEAQWFKDRFGPMLAVARADWSLSPLFAPEVPDNDTRTCRCGTPLAGDEAGSACCATCRGEVRA